LVLEGKIGLSGPRQPGRDIYVLPDKHLLQDMGEDRSVNDGPEVRAGNWLCNFGNWNVCLAEPLDRNNRGGDREPACTCRWAIGEAMEGAASLRSQEGRRSGPAAVGRRWSRE